MRPSCARRSATRAGASCGWRAGWRRASPSACTIWGCPGIAFRTELKRAYPLGALAGHVIGTVNIDNKGLTGIERTLDEMGRPEPVHGPGRTQKAPLRLSLDIGVQHALADELKQACATYGRRAAAGLILDANTGEIVAAESLPEVDSCKPADWRDAALADRLFGGTYELGSVFKTLTVAMALEAGTADLDKVYDVTQPLSTGPYTITDLHPQNRPLSVREIFLHSSNVGAGMLARELGSRRQRALLDSFGLLETMRTEAGPVAPPQLPKNWGDAETITIAYGHGLAVAPLAVRRRRRGPRQRRQQGDADAARRRRYSCRQTSHRVGGDQRQDPRDHAPQRHPCRRHRPARRGRGLPRRRQDRHGRAARTRGL